MRLFVLFLTAGSGIKAPLVLSAAGYGVPCSKVHRALNVQQPFVESTLRNEEHVRGHGGGRYPAAAIVLRFQESCVTQQAVKAVLDQVFGLLSCSSHKERPKGLGQQKRSDTTSTGATF